MVDPPPSPFRNPDPSAHTHGSISDDSMVAQFKSDSEKFLDKSTEYPKGSDPDGTYDSDEEASSSEQGDSTHGESMKPTRQDSYDNFEDVSPVSRRDMQYDTMQYETKDDLGRTWDSKMSVDSATTDEPFYDESTGYSSSRRHRPSVLAHEQNADVQSSLQSNIGLFRKMGMSVSVRQLETVPGDEEDGIEKPEEPRHSTFPSNRLLVTLVILIILACGVLVGCLTYFIWDKNTLDPMIPPGSTAADVAGFGIRVGEEYVPTDEELLELMVEISGNAAVTNPDTAAGKAAIWMLYLDAGRRDQSLLPRSVEGWQQRYILALTYIETTTGFGVNNTDSSWLSCNPPVDADDTCTYTFPTELPNGQVIYDLVPAYRWLSASDECLWGGVACTAKTYDNDPLRAPEAGPIVGSAVTSIVLADQNLNGKIVTELLSLPELSVLDLSHNGLEGSLTKAYGNLTTLKLSNNAIGGSIPADMIGKDSPLELLDLGSNEITGSIPSGISQSTSLKYISLENNRLKGSIPILGNMPLEEFYAQNNMLEGILPFDYGYEGTWPSTLKAWWVSDNLLTGGLPEGIGFLTSLEDFRVGGNKFVGTIPASIGDATRLFRFEVNENQLTGTIPESIASISSLQDVSLQFNGLTGVVPTDLCFLESMVTLEANCDFSDDEAEGARDNFAAEQEAEIQSMVGSGSNNDVIPVFSSLEEAVAAARAGGYVATQGPVDPNNPVKPAFVPLNTEVECYCCTTCCNPDSKECLTFSTNKLTTPLSTSSSGMVTNTDLGLTKDAATKLEVNSIEV